MKGSYLICLSGRNRKSSRFTVLLSLMFFALLSVHGQQTIPLYDNDIPNSIKTENNETSNEQQVYFNVSRPTLGIYLPKRELANGTAIIICPGGGYSGLCMKTQGHDIALKLNKLGVAAFVLKYRLPSDLTMKDKSIGPLQDAQRAIQVVRQNWNKWNIKTDQVGIMGFSAGGHLASTAETHFDKAYIKNKKETNLRPDFAILVYPVISFDDKLAHIGSRIALIGENPTAERILLFSNEKQVTPRTPATFLIQAEDDRMVPVDNSIVFYEALLKNNVPAGLHLFPKGDHGFPLEPAHSTWFFYCADWLRENHWLD